MVDESGPSSSHSSRPSHESKPCRRELLERTVHDLKNPLAVVRATLEWLEVELSDREDALDAVRDATSASERLVAIVEDLDTLSLLESGRRVRRDAVEISRVVAAVAASSNGRLASRQIQVALLAAVRIETTGDEALLFRTIQALVDTCARGAPSGACVEIEARVVPAAEGPPGGESVEIEVGLRGCEAVGPAVASIDDLACGGLGVYLALRVVEGHGGSLRVVPTASVPRVIASVPR